MSVQLPPWLAVAGQMLLPDPCLACGRPRHELPGPCGLCRSCHALLLPPPRPACGGCGLPMPGASSRREARCGSCRRSARPYDRLYSCWRYAEPLPTVVRALKFHRRERLATDLGTALASCLPRPPRWDLVVPVPLHWWRRLWRGFNQAELIAMPIALGLGLPMVRALSRRHATRPQTSLGRAARLRNPQCAFLARRAGVAGRAVLLIDDVATTGATLRAAADALRWAGATAVDAAVVGLALPE